jgi:hypothetical protein
MNNYDAAHNIKMINLTGQVLHIDEVAGCERERERGRG